MNLGNGNLSGWQRFPLLTLLGSLLALAFYLGGDAAFSLFCWKAGGLEAGELWRWVSGHFVHASASHLFYDVAAFVILGGFLELQGRRRFVQVVGGSVLLCAAFLELGVRYSVYCGLSGIDMGLFVGSALALLTEGRKQRDWLKTAIGVAAILLALGKIAWEAFRSEALFLDGGLAGFSVAVEAHLAGALAAFFCFSLTTYQLVGFKFRPCHQADKPKRLDSGS